MSDTMLRHRFAPWLACAALVGTSASAAAAAPTPGCVTIQVESRYYESIGYSHLATAKSVCAQPVECQLWTNVDPAPQRIELRSGNEQDVLFRRGSPASEFRAFARCQFLK